MIEKIGNIEIDLTYYSGQDNYSDGDIEDIILNYVKKNQNDKILFTDNRWPILYHFSPKRRNILEWYNFLPNANLLEIGAGCGALTGLFCEKLESVVAVELSRRRSEIIAYRCKEFSNLRIIVSNVLNIDFKDKFSYVTLIGVLEYAKMFSKTEDPVSTLLQRVRNLLQDKGQLIIAIENKFGLKYWNGAAEDHSGLYFEGLQNYQNSYGIITFSKAELTNLLENAGFHKIYFYYPYPDYKLPKEVYSDQYLPSIGQIRSLSPNFDQKRYMLFKEDLVLDNIIQNKMFDLFANSYLIIAEKKGNNETNIY